MSGDRILDIVATNTREVAAPKTYNFLKKGALTYIVDPSGRIVSDGYHEFSIFKHEKDDTKIVGLLGRLGAMKRALRPPTDDDPFFRASEEDFHKIEFRPDLGDRFVIQTGALKYLIDNTGKKITEGYHEITSREGKIYGTTGPFTSEINITEEVTPDFNLMLEAGSNH